jgi:hypothetical protein
MAATPLSAADETVLAERPGGGPATLDERARRIGVPRRTTRLRVDAVVALGLADRPGDRDRNDAAAAMPAAGHGSGWRA